MWVNTTYLKPQSQVKKIVEPSSALRSCTAEKRTSSLPHLGHVWSVRASVFTSCRWTVCTEDSFWRRKEGKSEGFDFVMMVLEAESGPMVSGRSASDLSMVSLALVLSTAAFALQDVLGTALGRRQEVSAVIAENQGSNGGHFRSLLSCC